MARLDAPTAVTTGTRAASAVRTLRNEITSHTSTAASAANVIGSLPSW